MMQRTRVGFIHDFHWCRNAQVQHLETEFFWQKLGFFSPRMITALNDITGSRQQIRQLRYGVGQN